MFSFANPEAIGVFGLIVAVFCFGLEQIGVGIKGADMQKVTRTLGFIAIVFGGVAQLYTAISFYLFNLSGAHSAYIGTIFAYFGLFWIVVGLFFIKGGGDKKVMAHFFLVGLVIVVLFTIEAFNIGKVWPLGIDLIVIDILLITLVAAWYTEKKIFTRFAGVCNLAIGFISFFLLYPNILT